MAVEEIHVGDVGTSFRRTAKDASTGAVIDISAASTLQIIFKKPSGEILTATASLINSGTDGLFGYTTVAGDLDEAGVWEWQGRIAFSASQSWKSNVKTFRVYPNL